MTAPDLTRAALCELFGIPFTDEQLDAITAPYEPSVVIAGAGSGKTSIMSARVVWLVVHHEVAPDSVLGLTFTNKAAAELSARVRGALRRLESLGRVAGLLDDGEPTISTYHSYAGALLREYGVWGGYEPAAQLLTDAQRFQLAESVVRRAPGPFPSLGVQLKAVTERVVALDGEANEHLVDLDDLESHDRSLIEELTALEREEGKLSADPSKARVAARARLELLGLVKEYRHAKQRRDVIDFGDQMARAALLAERVDRVGAGERERFATVLLDEYQDTSMAQQRLLVALFGPGYPVMAVGDPFQSIYGWRGASIRNILSFGRDFSDDEKAPVFALGQNNRSGGRILTSANAIAQPLRDEFPGVGELRPRPGEDDTGEVLIGMYRTSADETVAVCDAIEAEVADGRPPHEIAVLCRETKSFTALIAGLTERKIPIDVVGLSGLLEVPEVVDVIAVLEVLHDPTANPQLVRILSGPRWRIGPVDLALLGSRARTLAAPRRAQRQQPEGVHAASPQTSTLARELLKAVAGTDPAEAISLLEALDDPGACGHSEQALERFAALSRELTALRRVLELPPDAAIAEVIGVLGLDIELAVAGRPRDHLDALLEQARLFTASGGGTTVGPFLTYLRLSERYGDTLGMAAPTGGGGVALLTVHKAKGLEWHSVYVPSVVDKVFPNTRSRSTPYTSGAVLPYSLRGDAADFPLVSTWSGNQGVQEFKAQVAEREHAEERRLAYVALTRAALRLVVTGHWWGPNQQRPRGLSPYLQTLHDLSEHRVVEVLNWQAEPSGDETNPALDIREQYQWPVAIDPVASERRRASADLVLTHMGRLRTEVFPPSANEVERTMIAEWDENIEALLAEAERTTVPGTRPVGVVSATSAVLLLRDPGAARQRMRRPLPRPPADAARRGTRFHQWVEARFGQVPLLDLDGFEDADDPFDTEMETLQQAFMSGPYAHRSPLAVEAPFQMVLGDSTVAGRIDAVYDVDGGDPALPADARYEVVDWKTGRHPADEMQLALYRIAWAELNGVRPESVVATFYYVATGQLERPDTLPDRATLAALWAAVDK
jgi:DNA helicase-2/ATP-dependent DNA helicase PcrA